MVFVDCIAILTVKNIESRDNRCLRTIGLKPSGISPSPSGTIAFCAHEGRNYVLVWLDYMRVVCVRFLIAIDLGRHD
jgi:hypothetical protein